jgi:hypothetical protein
MTKSGLMATHSLTYFDRWLNVLTSGDVAVRQLLRSLGPAGDLIAGIRDSTWPAAAT